MAYARTRKRARKYSRAAVRKKASINRALAKKIDWTKYAAKGAGATLGYIGGGINGVSVGWNAAGAATRLSRKLKEKFINRNAVSMKAESTGLQVKELGVLKLGGSKVMKTLANYDYSNSNQWMITSQQGVQAVDYTELLFTRPQLIGDVSPARWERWRWHDDPFKLNPYYTRAGTDVYPAGTGAGVQENDYLYIKNVKFNLSLLSLMKIPQEVIVYLMMPKFDTNVNPIDCWNQILVDKRMGQTGQNESTAIATTDAGAGYAQSSDIGANPFIHKEFRNQWEAVKTVKIALQAGEQLNFNIKLSFEKVISRSTIENTRQSFYLRGLTVFPMVIAHAGMVGISTDLNAEATEVAYGKVKLGTISHHQIKFGALPQNRFSSSRTYSGVVERSAAHQRIIDDEDDIDDPAGAA